MTELEGRELDAAVAERVMGVDKEQEIDLAILDPVGVTDSFRATIWANILPHYSTDIAAAWLVEERIKELGLESEYSEALLNITDASEHFEMIHASPEDRCRAARMAVEAE